MFPVEALLNSSLAYCTCQIGMQEYDDFLPSFRLDILDLLVLGIQH